MSYFSDRERGPRAQTEEEISVRVWRAILAIINSRIRDGSFGYRFPDSCPEFSVPCGCDYLSFWNAVEGEIEGIERPEGSYADEAPPTLPILDFIEFCYASIAAPIQLDYHSFFSHHHLRFDPDTGKTLFRDDINRLFARNGLAYTLNAMGKVERIAPGPLGESLKTVLFRTGDNDLDSLLEEARAKYLHPDLKVRKESLEKLWDAWERLKTMEPGKDKKASTESLLNGVTSEAVFREVVEKEAHELTRIGNTFMIRHSEKGKVPIERSEDVDYLFHRMFSLVILILKATSRVG